ncbi:uncharacterized protein LOC131258268 isoform X2 [Magnolia sinica]|uniref:uncharacterized protein LOC131258268 isoform X2 n=1 Tax=Magnolia sinica TaxID=86752 RepID=UPI002659F3EA|nr:uncharacterized protein LOC131258268 isoform X2 [Magnolia sinica]
MHGREVEESKRRWHMRPGPATASTPVASPADSPSVSSATVTADSFCKDGRKISVGDCALFQGRDSQPFIGIIRWLTSGKEDSLKLGVNWLYRPADVTLGKGIVLEAAPNEVFYSFHRDAIPAATLLHPCKVAFLRKGVELPSGLSSFVCRRVYDIENHCLWWLTDQDYINERQEEVDQLLDKTRLEMHAAVQSGGRSPKPLNGPTSTAQQLKPGSESVQNSAALFPSQGNKGRKRVADQGSDPIKRERSSKTDDGDSSNFRLESMIKAEIAKITDKGGLINAEGVEKLVHLMQHDRAEKKIDMMGRIMLAEVVAATERFDCLDRFVQLRGVPVLDDWLQEAHKGKVGDGNSPKEGDKSVEELLLALLRALDKLPVNLHALQTCNVGKSVNHLRSHKNLDIQKKARSLVDTWKKRVEAEMKINEAKSGSSHQAVSWPGKPAGYSEVSHGGGNRRAGPYEVALKGYIMQTSASKTTGSIKLGQGDAVAKPTSASTAGSVKLTPTLPASAPLSSKDSYCKMVGSGSISDMPPATTLKEEKSSSSSQSQNNSQSCSSDHTRAVASAWKEDARSSTAGSISAKTSTTGASRTRRSSNGVLGSGVSVVQKESALGKPSTSNRNSTPDKTSQSGVTCERVLDMPPADHGNSHRLIVRLPNPGRSPARSASGGSFDEPPVIGSRASSPGDSEKQDHCDRRAKGKSDTCQAVGTTADVNTESWQSNDVKDGLAGSDEGDRSSAAVVDEERSRNTDEIVKPTDMSKASFQSSRNGKGDFSSINALIESCVKYSEASTSLSAGDDLGMNLLASVAAGEMLKSELVSPGGSPDRNPPAPDDSVTGNNTKSGREEVGAQAHGQPDGDPLKQGSNVEPFQVKDELLQISSTHVTVNTSGDSKSISSLSEHKPTNEQSELPPPSVDLHQTAEPCVKSDTKPDETAPSGCVSESTGLTCSEAPPVVAREGQEVERPNQRPKRRKASVGRNADYKPRLRSASLEQNKMVDHASDKVAHNSSTAPSKSVRGDVRAIDQTAPSIKESKQEAVEESPSCPALKTGSENVDRVHEGLAASVPTEQQPPTVVANHTEASDRSGEHASAPSGSGSAPCPESFDESTMAEKAEGMEKKSLLGPGASESIEQTAIAPPTVDERAAGNVDPVVLDHSSSDRVEENTERKEVVEHRPTGSAPQQESAAIPAEQCMKSTGPKLSSIEADEREESMSANAAGSDIASKLDFDLNEGFPVDEGNQSELGASSAAPGCSSAVHLPSPVSFSVSPMSSGLPASITVAAAARGPFVHDNLLRNKGEVGWKGSASTSAFRPAEPRRVLEMPLNTIDVPPPDTTACKQSRPALDIDLNVPDDRVNEDMASQSSVRETGSESRGPISNRDMARSDMFSSSPAPFRSTGLDLDLNRVDESADNGQFLASTSRRLEAPLLPARSSSSSGFPNGEMNALRDFDLNNGPSLDEGGAEAAPRNQHAKSSGLFLPPHVGSIRMNSTELGSLSQWFPPGTSYTIPSFLSDRGGDQPYPTMVATGAGQRILGSATGGTFGGDLYRGPVLSSSPAMTFSPANAFPYAGFPFSSANPFPLASTSFSGGPTPYMDSSSGGGQCFPTIPSQLIGPTGAVSSHYQRPYMMSIPEGTATTSSSGGGAESSRKWGRQGLDLNAGPGNADVEGRDERLLPSASRQLSVANPQALAEEQARIYQQQAAAAAAAAGGGVLKRKEPDGGGWDGDRFSSYKQPSWHQ